MAYRSCSPPKGRQPVATRASPRSSRSTSHVWLSVCPATACASARPIWPTRKCAILNTNRCSHVCATRSSNVYSIRTDMVIDLNCDMGESFGAWSMGQDAQVMPWISSANIACGFHAGDFSTMQRTVILAKKHDVAIGAHVSLPDLQGFGRREMRVTPSEAHALTLYQLGALHAFTHAQQVLLHHVKPHGALYNMAAKDEKLAAAIANAVRD